MPEVDGGAGDIEGRLAFGFIGGNVLRGGVPGGNGLGIELVSALSS